MPLSNKVEVSTSDIHGRCLRTKEEIKEGEVLWEAGEWNKDPKYIHKKTDVLKWPKAQQDAFWALSYPVFYILLFYFT
jgi:hypothetical protein